MAITLNRNSTVNSNQNTLYTFKLGLSFDVTDGTIVIQIPTDI